MNILGVNNEMYISSAALSKDGSILVAAAEERFSREKMTRAFPANAVQFCLDEAGVSADDLDAWAVAWNPGSYFRKFNPGYSAKRRHLVEQLYSVPDHVMGFYGRPNVDHVVEDLVIGERAVRVYYISHHRAHAANGFYLSPFERAAILTADSQGEFEATTLCRGEGNGIEVIETQDYPHSLGMLYGTLTEFLGFRPNSDEWKVMALASYADWDNQYYEFLNKLVVRRESSGLWELDLRYFSGYLHEQPGLFTTLMEGGLGAPREPGSPLDERHEQIAAAMQRLSEEWAVALMERLYARTGEANLVLSGGFFMNSVFNGRARRLGPFENVFVGPCPDDSGNALGAALYLHNQILGSDRGPPLRHNYLGPRFAGEEVERALQGFKVGYQHLDDPARTAAELIAEGQILGWFQGRMEFGQRALGNRSILADPRRADMRDEVNRSVKFREGFRPFAPAVLEERVSEYFEIEPGDSAVFMEKVFPVRPSVRARIPAVVHVDGSGRLQTVQADTNPRFHRLITAFEEITGEAVVLNTSFNLNGEPVVCTPQDALRTFFSSGLDALVVEDFLVTKS